jgi:hypothetical protein
MDIHFIVEVLHQTGYFPDFDGWVNTILFLIIACGFAFIVVGSKKYSYLFDSIEKYF